MFLFTGKARGHLGTWLLFQIPLRVEEVIHEQKGSFPSLFTLKNPFYLLKARPIDVVALILLSDLQCILGTAPVNLEEYNIHI